MNDLFIIIPARNEERTLGSVIKKIKKLPPDLTPSSFNIVVVDDGSQDQTAEVARKEKVTIISHAINLGKGSALRTGCDYALQKGAQRLILMDSDGQHDPEEIPQFLDALTNTDIVFGCRSFNKKMPLVFRIGNYIITLIASLLYGVKVRDTLSGYRALTTEAYQKVRWISSDYSVETEMIANMRNKQLKYREIPIKTIYGDNYKGTTIFDGVHIVLKMLMWRLKLE